MEKVHKSAKNMGNWCQKTTVSPETAMMKLQQIKQSLIMRIKGCDYEIEKNKRLGMESTSLETKKMYARIKLQKEESKTKFVQMMIKVSSIIDTIDQQGINLEVVDGLRTGNQEMTLLLEQVSVDDVEELLDRLHEAMDDTNDVSEALTRPLQTEEEEEDEMVLPSVPVAKQGIMISE